MVSWPDVLGHETVFIEAPREVRLRDSRRAEPLRGLFQHPLKVAGEFEATADPHSLDLRTWVNGEPRQSSNTKHLIFDCFALIEHLSTAFTLEPGDVIPTGTPGGVGIAQKPPKLLKAGDVVRIAIEGIGEIENAVIEEPESTVRF